MAERTMVGNWTGPQSSSMRLPPSSSGMRPAGAHRAPSSAPWAERPSTLPPPATSRRPAPPPVDIQICLALCGRPASLYELSPELAEVRGAGELVPPGAIPAPELPSWSGRSSVMPLGRPSRAAAVKQPAPVAPAVPVAHPAAVPEQPVAAPPVVHAPVVQAPAAQPPAAQPLQPPRPGVAQPSVAQPPRPTAAAPAQTPRRKRWLPWALAALVMALVAGALMLRLPAPIAATGTLSAPATVAVTSTLPGTLVQLLVQPGDTVAEGQLVAQLATTPFEAELLLRWDAFVELQAELAAEEPDEGISREQSAAALAHAAWALVEAQRALAEASVRAPCRGRVEALAARPGRAVLAGQPLLQLAPAGAGRSILAVLPEAEHPFVQPGTSATVLLPAAEQQAPLSASARVTHLAPSATASEDTAAPEAAGEVSVQLELEGLSPEQLDQLETGAQVSLRLPGREQRALGVLLDWLGSLRGMDSLRGVLDSPRSVLDSPLDSLRSALD